MREKRMRKISPWQICLVAMAVVINIAGGQIAPFCGCRSIWTVSALSL